MDFMNVIKLPQLKFLKVLEGVEITRSLTVMLWKKSYILQQFYLRVRHMGVPT